MPCRVGFLFEEEGNFCILIPGKYRTKSDVGACMPFVIFTKTRKYTQWDKQPPTGTLP